MRTDLLPGTWIRFTSCMSCRDVRENSRRLLLIYSTNGHWRQHVHTLHTATTTTTTTTTTVLRPFICDWQWHQLKHMQVTCISFQTASLSFYRPDALPAAQPTVSKHWRHNRHTTHYSELKVLHYNQCEHWRKMTQVYLAPKLYFTLQKYCN